MGENEFKYETNVQYKIKIIINHNRLEQSEQCCSPISLTRGALNL